MFIIGYCYMSTVSCLITVLLESLYSISMFEKVLKKLFDAPSGKTKVVLIIVSFPRRSLLNLFKQ